MKILGLFSLLEYRQQLSIVYRCEEQLLVRIEVHGLGDNTVLHGLEVLGALGDNDNISTILAVQWLTQSAGRQQLVIDNQAVIVYQQDVDARFDIAVLEGIVKQNDINILVVFNECVNTMATVLVYSNDDIRIFLLHLERLVANLRHCRLCGGLQEPFALTLISTA